MIVVCVKRTHHGTDLHQISSVTSKDVYFAGTIDHGRYTEYVWHDQPRYVTLDEAIDVAVNNEGYLVDIISYDGQIIVCGRNELTKMLRGV